jgi:cobalt/nickel transport system permease protein
MEPTSPPRADAISSPRKATLSPRAAVVLTVAFVAAVVAVPPAWTRTWDDGRYVDVTWTLLTLAAATAAGVRARLGQPIRALLLRWTAAAPVVGLLASPVLLSKGWAAGAPVWAAMIAKALLCLGAVTTLTDAVPAARVLEALRRLGVPALLVSVAAFMVRYRELLADELSRMRRARQARNFGGRRLGDWPVLAGMISVLFVRAFERAERVHRAMIARGWDGRPRSLRP